MTRSELASLLGAPAGLVAEPPRLVTVIETTDPRSFMTEFAHATAQGGVVMLANTTWGENERRQLAALRDLPQVTPATAAGKGWLCIPTGGTSGEVKFARHDEETLAAAVRGFARHFGVTQVNAMGVLPLHHVSGLMAWLRCAFTGGEYRPLDWKAVEAGERPELPAKPGGWMISLVPTQLERLLGNWDCRAGSPNPAGLTDEGRRDAAIPPYNQQAIAWLKQFRTIFLGGGPAWPELLDRAVAARLPLSLGYGMTESAAMLTALRPAEFLAGARSCGEALPHASVKIGADDTIVIGGDSLFRGYHPQWRDRFDFETQDRGRLDAQRHLQVSGRRDATIITGGEKVEPAEVEAVLKASGQFPGIVVLGLPDPKWGQVVVAAYPATTTPDPVKVREFLRGRLAPHKIPKRYIPMSTWPANEQGKVNRADVLRFLVEFSRVRRVPDEETSQGI